MEALTLQEMKNDNLVIKMNKGILLLQQEVDLFRLCKHNDCKTMGTTVPHSRQLDSGSLLISSYIGSETCYHTHLNINFIAY
ncbi:hypothetical protein BA953_05610 [Vibrio coralliilyticus]|nr:hypothetical protein BA953_05610 [Vibrio coralliilyticus]